MSVLANSLSDKALIKRIEELEKTVKKLSDNKLNMFGTSHETVGSSTSDLVLKTRGKIKILWGAKFIDLLKDGKINVETDFIYTASNKDSIGSKPGIYVTDDGGVYLKPKSGDIVNLLGEVGTTYVSFLEPQITTSDNKHIALENIGFLYSDINSISENSLKNGIIYVESELKLYHVKNGELIEYTFKFPNPFTELFVISKNDASTGSLLIVGQGKNNSVAFDKLFIYSEYSKSIIDSNNPIVFKYNNLDCLTITNTSSIFNNTVTSNTFQSPSYTLNTGFKLYMINGKSILEVDLVIERDAEDSFKLIYPEYWLINNNVILSVEDNIITLVYPNSFKKGDILRIYIKTPETEEEDESKSYTALDLEVDEIIDELNILVTEDLPENISNTYIFLISEEGIRFKSNIDIVNGEEIKSRVGNLSDLNLQRSDDSQITGFGIYSNLGAFLEALYVKGYNLPQSDSSSKFASTEWVSNVIPIGTIIMYHGTTIPEGWAICDGTNGTPNLIGKFIKASTVAGNTGGSDTILLGIENMPTHSHTIANTSVNSSNSSKLIPAYDELYENAYDLGGSSHYTVESGYNNKGDKGLVGIKVGDILGSVTLELGGGQPLNWSPSYYTLVFIMKIK